MRMHLIIISGLSGSGKSIALNMLEDSDYFCVDNLPSQLLASLIDQLRQQGFDKVAVAIDIRGGNSVAMLPQQLSELRASHDLEFQFLFLDAKTEALLKRFSETRRRHPLANDRRSVGEAILEERIRLAGLSGLGHHIDTSDLKPHALREWVRQFIANPEKKELALFFQSFGYKHGIPLDAELVFDVRCLPNPFYEPTLRPLTGHDRPVVEFLESEPEVTRMRSDIARFVSEWLPCYVRDGRNHLTVGIGCTGGQHRSVYLVEWLCRQPWIGARALPRHRELRADGDGKS